MNQMVDWHDKECEKRKTGMDSIRCTIEIDHSVFSEQLCFFYLMEYEIRGVKERNRVQGMK